jgi:predicted NBD/HSP70 family sugar kinase
MTAIVAFDVGGTTTRVAIDDGGTRTYIERPTLIDTAAGLLPHLIACLKTVLQSARLDSAVVAAIGIGVPGTVDDTTGTVRLASNLHIGHTPLPLRDELRARIDVPIAIENDVKTAALGLTNRLADSSNGVLTYLSVGTGIASASVINGRVLRGMHGSAGEVGQIQLEPNGVAHLGSLPGSLEALAAGPVIENSPDEPIEHLARAIHALFMLFDPEVLIVGGGAVERQGIRTRIVAALESLRVSSPTTASLIDIERLEFLEPEERPGIEGAIHLASQIPEMSDRSIRSAQTEGETA